MIKKIEYLVLVVFVTIFSMFAFACKNDKPELKIYLNSGVDTVELYSNFKDGGAVARYGNDLVAVKVTSNVDTSKVGTYTVKYEATYNDITISAERKVTVVDQTEPNLVLNPGIDTIRLGEEWIDAGVVASDNSMGEVNVTVSGNVNVNAIGEYIITYTGTDGSGNSSSIVRYVNVVGKN